MQELDDYITKARQQNKSDEEIRKALVDSNWDAAKVDDALGKSPKIWEGAFSAISDAFNLIIKHNKPAITYAIILSVVELIAFVAQLTVKDGVGHYLPSIVQTIVLLLLTPFTIRYQLSLARNEERTFAELARTDIVLYLKLLAGYILTGLLIVIACIPLLIPLIWVIPIVSLVFFIIVDDNASPITAFQESSRLVKHHKGTVWGLVAVSVLVSGGAFLLSFIPVVGSVTVSILSIVTQTAMAKLYLWLKANAVTEA